MERDPYVVLGVSRDADLRAIKRAFRALARRFHPDVSREMRDDARFREVREAYDLLADPARRGEFDERRAGAGRSDERRAAAEEEDDPLDAIFRAMFAGGEGADGGPRGAGDWLRPPGQRFEGRVSGSGRVELDAYLTREEGRRGTTVPFRFQLGPRLVAADITLPPGVRTGQRLRYEVAIEPGLALTVIVHIEIGD
jgi:curved DNA-binding protein CbpA